MLIHFHTLVHQSTISQQDHSCCVVIQRKSRTFCMPHKKKKKTKTITEDIRVKDIRVKNIKCE